MSPLEGKGRKKSEYCCFLTGFLWNNDSLSKGNLCFSWENATKRISLALVKDVVFFMRGARMNAYVQAEEE